MRISVQPELLRSLSRQLLQSGDQFIAITHHLNSAINSLVWETSLKAAVIDEWQSAQRQGEHLGALLSGMGRHLQTKADLFQDTDHQYNTILDHALTVGASPTALFAAYKQGAGPSILPDSAGGSSVISNPSSAAAAVGMGKVDGGNLARQAAMNGQGWTFADPATLNIAN